MVRSKSIARAITVVAIGGMLAAGFAISPSFSAAPLTKAKVRKIDKQTAGRVAIASGKAVDSTTGPTGTLLTTSITAPKPGFLVITGDGNWANYTGSEDTHGCKIFVDGTEVESRVIASGGATNQEVNCSIATALQVGKGAHTVDYRWFNVDAGNVTYTDRILIAQYVPFNATGVRP
jgi:hypothetical protein